MDTRPCLPSCAPAPQAILFQDKSISLVLRAPNQAWLFWGLAAAYMVMLMVFGPFVVWLAGVFAFPSRGHEGVSPARALWLWVLGIVAASILLTSAASWKPEGMSLEVWSQSSPLLVAATVGAVLLALGVLLWHLSWSISKTRS